MILSTIYGLAGQTLGMPTILETGFATGDDGTLNKLREYEHEDLQLVRVRRRAGLIAKSLSGEEILMNTIQGEEIGRFANCVQVGRTEIAYVAPRQPLAINGTQGRVIVKYSRTWVHLGA